MRNSIRRLAWSFLLLVFVVPTSARAEEDWTGEWLFRAVPEGSVPLRTSQKAWADPERKLVIVDGEVCTRSGPLEMLACPRNTKEYESVIVVDALPGIVHQGLVKVGAKPGSPASFDPYRSASGTPIEVMIVWVGKDGKRHAVRAQEWIKDIKTGKPMKHNWVFAGSHWVKNGEDAPVKYQADLGDFICVANFSTAAIDLPVESPQANTSLAFEAFTDEIPPEKTKVRIVIVPQLEEVASE